ncbi:ornithine cyclodeaminase family protein [Amnibacterium flavum]|uniref:Ornithine cyclodeaminase family protein n=1 Tax=Amnibacterium flavum TaxID=2173173 RepID=A0A2V1HKX8_9MICO|nr:ornithine cyclodeaminase family protein [Amnibacterium flavum]
MIVMTEERSASLVSEELALEAARLALTSVGGSTPFPVVVGFVAGTQNRFTIKSGSASGLSGAKIGSFWPNNAAAGLPRHSSTVILLDESTGRVAAVVEAGAGNAYRTAAADAVAVEILARRDARILAVLGTGNQARYEARAVARVRPIDEILIAGRNRAAAEALAARVHVETGVRARAAGVEEACGEADIIATVTTAREPLFDAEWIRPGTHVSAMGADGPGKQELPSGLYASARLFCDVIDQSRSIGEFQHAPHGVAITTLGDVLNGVGVGRTGDEEITVFDSSGFALQDLTLADALISRADNERTRT